MPRITPVLHLFLLQEPVRYFKEDNPVEALILVIAIAVIVLTALVFYFYRRGGRKTVVGSNTTYSAPKRFNIFTLRRAVAPYGLSGEQTKLLEYVFRNDNVTDPARVLKDPVLLDRHFKRAYRNIEKDSRGTERTQQNLSKLFVLRNAIEAAPVEDDTYTSQPVENSHAILKYGKDNYNVRILLSKGNSIVTEVPKNILGTPLRVSRGDNVTLTYLSKSNNGYSLACGVVGTEKTEHGSGFQVNSTGRAKPLTKRQSRRKQVDVRCEFYFVQLIERGKGRRKTTRMVVSPKRFAGDIKDLSAGGCSIKTVVQVQAGSRLKINCNLDNKEQISVLGQVIRSNRSPAGTVIHVKFLKVPVRAFNSINTMVFGFNDNENEKNLS
jgi:hypothetical protein